MSLRLTCLALVAAALAGCGDAPAPASEAPPAAAAAAAGPGIDWARCRIAGATLPIGGKLFVVDGGPPPEDAEPGRESIRRIDVLVPGPVALLLTASDATVWAIRASPETQVQAVFASGEQPQRITGQGLGPAQRAVSGALGEACGRYWLQGGAGAPLNEVTQEVFGRPHDAVYRMQIGSIVIGGPESSLPEGVDPAR